MMHTVTLGKRVFEMYVTFLSDTSRVVLEVEDVFLHGKRAHHCSTYLYEICSEL